MGGLAEVTFGLVHSRYSLPFICRTDPLHQLNACMRGGGRGRIRSRRPSAFFLLSLFTSCASLPKQHINFKRQLGMRKTLVSNFSSTV